MSSSSSSADTVAAASLRHLSPVSFCVCVYILAVFECVIKKQTTERKHWIPPAGVSKMLNSISVFCSAFTLGALVIVVLSSS